jgi:hypothetical protein
VASAIETFRFGLQFCPITQSQQVYFLFCHRGFRIVVVLTDFLFLENWRGFFHVQETLISLKAFEHLNIFD